MSKEHPICPKCGGAQWATNQRPLCHCSPLEVATHVSVELKRQSTMVAKVMGHMGAGTILLAIETEGETPLQPGDQVVVTLSYVGALDRAKILTGMVEAPAEPEPRVCSKCGKPVPDWYNGDDDDGKPCHLTCYRGAEAGNPVHDDNKDLLHGLDGFI